MRPELKFQFLDGGRITRNGITFPNIKPSPYIPNGSSFDLVIGESKDFPIVEIKEGRVKGFHPAIDLELDKFLPDPVVIKTKSNQLIAYIAFGQKGYSIYSQLDNIFWEYSGEGYPVIQAVYSTQTPHY